MLIKFITTLGNRTVEQVQLPHSDKGAVANPRGHILTYFLIHFTI